MDYLFKNICGKEDGILYSEDGLTLYATNGYRYVRHRLDAPVAEELRGNMLMQDGSIDTRPRKRIFNETLLNNVTSEDFSETLSYLLRLHKATKKAAFEGIPTGSFFAVFGFFEETPEIARTKSMLVLRNERTFALVGLMSAPAFNVTRETLADVEKEAEKRKAEAVEKRAYEKTQIGYMYKNICANTGHDRTLAIGYSDKGTRAHAGTQSYYVSVELDEPVDPEMDNKSYFENGELHNSMFRYPSMHFSAENKIDFSGMHEALLKLAKKRKKGFKGDRRLYNDQFGIDANAYAKVAWFLKGSANYHLIGGALVIVSDKATLYLSTFRSDSCPEWTPESKSYVLHINKFEDLCSL